MEETKKMDDAATVERNLADTVMESLLLSEQEERRAEEKLKRELAKDEKAQKEVMKTMSSLKSQIDAQKAENSKVQAEIDTVSAEVIQLRLKAGRMHGFCSGFNSISYLFLFSVGVALAIIFFLLIARNIATAVFPPTDARPV